MQMRDVNRRGKMKKKKKNNKHIKTKDEKKKKWVELRACLITVPVSLLIYMSVTWKSWVNDLEGTGKLNLDRKKDGGIKKIGDAYPSAFPRRIIKQWCWGKGYGIFA